MKVVNLMTKHQLIKAYKALPYIIHKKKFLIPQRPFPPTYDKVHFRNNLLRAFEKKFPELVTEEMKLKIDDPLKQPQFVNLFLQKVEEQRLKYYEQILEYTKKYILPLKQLSSSMRPEFLYFRIHSSQIREKLIQNNQKYDIRVIYDTYKALPEEQKRLYEKKVQESVNKKIEGFVQACKLYEIPSLTVPKTNVLYLREVKQEPITQDMLGQYKLLPAEVKKVYQQKYKQLKASKQAELVSFLGRFGLSEIEFAHIKDICQEISSLQTAQKRLRAAQKKQLKNKLAQLKASEALDSAKEENTVSKSQSPEKDNQNVSSLKSKQMQTQTDSELKGEEQDMDLSSEIDFPQENIEDFIKKSMTVIKAFKDKK